MVTFSNNASGQGVRDVQCPTNAQLSINSIVLASATEVFFDGGSGQWIPFQGSASIQVLNCVPKPQEGAVYVRVNILWDSDLVIRISGVII